MLDKSLFQLRGDDDDLRVDHLCRQLLRHFYDQLLHKGIAPAIATGWATGADYYVRDFIVDNRRLSVFDEIPGVIRKFAGTWYIITTVEPNRAELAGILAGIREFYRFLHDEGMVSTTFLEQAVADCDNLDWYERRIESFLAIAGDGYLAWERECSLKESDAPFPGDGSQ
jgi:hypothetical protein